jgi:hypothetical protein
VIVHFAAFAFQDERKAALEIIRAHRTFLQKKSRPERPPAFFSINFFAIAKGIK